MIPKYRSVLGMVFVALQIIARAHQATPANNAASQCALERIVRTVLYVVEMVHVSLLKIVPVFMDIQDQAVSHI